MVFREKIIASCPRAAAGGGGAITKCGEEGKAPKALPRQARRKERKEKGSMAMAMARARPVASGVRGPWPWSDAQRGIPGLLRLHLRFTRAHLVEI